MSTTSVLPPLLLGLILLAGCATDADTGPEPPWDTDGDRTLSGNAYFFTMESIGVIDQVTDVAGAEVYILEAPHIRQTLEPADGHSFTLTGIPDDVDVTLALVHDDYFPHLTATHHVGTEDLDSLNFQAVSHTILNLLAGLYDVDPRDESKCHMVSTVTAISGNQDEWWAVGEPGATVTIDPAVPASSGPIYFDTSVLPDRDLTETSDDGGVIVFGAEPGVYRWEAHKDGFSFDSLTMTCVGGWVTNGAPPWGMQAHIAP